MKKLILLLALPLTVLMAIDFTMTKEGLFTETTVESPTPTPTLGTNPEAENPYLEPVNLPECDAYNPEVQFIKTNEDWKTINSSSKRIFCVSPGDYRSLKNIILTASGTAEKRRYIILHNGNDTHPAKLPLDKVANFALTLKQSSYWIIDRIAVVKPYVSRAIDLQGARNQTPGSGCTHNIINRLYASDMGSVVRFGTDGDSNTLQNSRIENMTLNNRKKDVMAIIIEDNIYNTPSMTITNTKIINNEIVNTNDGLHIGRHPYDGPGDITRQHGNIAGTIVDSNDFYITSDIYTNGKGVSDINGKFSYSEDGIDMKIGSDDPDNPVIISNNHLWGFRKSDRTESLIWSKGNGIITHMGVYNIKILDNVVFNCQGGIRGAIGNDQNEPYAIKNAEIKRNLLYETGPMFSGSLAKPLLFSGTKNINVSENTIINSRGSYLYLATVKGVTCIKNNTIINQENGSTIDISNIPSIWEEATNDCLNRNFFHTSTQEADYTDAYTFTTDKYTNNPRVITLKNAVKTN